MNKRNCECCMATYATGKSYGDYWTELPTPDLELKGLCEFCSPNNTTWYIKDKTCHKDKIAIEQTKFHTIPSEKQTVDFLNVADDMYNKVNSIEKGY